MPLLACKIERTGSILHSHGVVCARVCACDVVCVNIHAYICVLHVHLCVVVCTRSLVRAFMCFSAFQMVDTKLQVYHTSANQHSYCFGNAEQLERV